jgi:hypothetical protein
MHELTTQARTAIRNGTFERYRTSILTGTPPWNAVST